jgi:hypothetical protein
VTRLRLAFVVGICLVPTCGGTGYKVDDGASAAGGHSGATGGASTLPDATAATTDAAGIASDGRVAFCRPGPPCPAGWFVYSDTGCSPPYLGSGPGCSSYGDGLCYQTCSTSSDCTDSRFPDCSGITWYGGDDTMETRYVCRSSTAAPACPSGGAGGGGTGGGGAGGGGAGGGGAGGGGTGGWGGAGSGCGGDGCAGAWYGGGAGGGGGVPSGGTAGRGGAGGSGGYPSAGTGGRGGAGGAGGVGGGGGSPAAGGAGGDGGTMPSGSLAGFCGALCDERYRCGSLDPNERPRTECIADCVYDWGPSDVYRGDVFGAIQACLGTLECSRSVDECNLAGANVVSSDPENHPLVTSCVAKVAACEGSANPFNDDFCLMGLFMLESVKPNFNACMAVPCDTVRACLETLLGKWASRPLSAAGSTARRSSLSLPARPRK